MFVHLRGRSTYSMLEWIGSLTSIFQKAKELWQTAIALTDLYGLYGVVDFYSKSKGFEIKPLVGVEIPFVPYLSTFQWQKWTSHPATLTVLAKNNEGYHNLLRLVSAGYTNVRDEIPFIDTDILQQFWKELIVLIGWLNSYAHYVSQENNLSSLRDFVDTVIHCCGKENCYIDITAQRYQDYPYLQESHTALLSVGQDLGLSMVTSSGYYYPEALQKTAYETALAIKDGKRAYDADARKIAGDNHHILSEAEVRAILANNGFADTMIDHLVTATGECADRCITKITLGQALFPNFQSPQEVLDLYEKYQGVLVENN